jgi:hypothetical protein
MLLVGERIFLARNGDARARETSRQNYQTYREHTPMSSIRS